MGLEYGKVALTKNHTFQITVESRQYANCFYPRRSGGRLNKKDGLTRYGDSHVKNKTS